MPSTRAAAPARWARPAASRSSHRRTSAAAATAARSSRGDPALADKIRLLRGHGSHPKYYHKVVGGNFRLDTIHAAVLRVKLPLPRRLDAARQQGAAYYTASLAKHGLAGGLVQVPRTVQSRHIFNQYVLRLEDRDGVRDHLKKEGITTEVYYPCPMHLQECFAYLGHRPGDFPESEKAAGTTLALPMYPEMSHTQRERVVRGIAAHYEATGRLSRRLAA